MSFIKREPGSSQYDDGLEVNRQDEGLQYHGSQYKDKEPIGYNTPTTQAPAAPAYSDYNTAQRRNPWDLRPLMFGLLVALVTALVVGAAVGGGVGGALSSARRSSGPDTAATSGSPISTTTTTVSATASSTATTNVTDYDPIPAQNVATVKWNCPDFRSYSTVRLNPDQKFDISCGVDFNHGTAAYEGGVVADIVGIIAYSAEDCMEACANMNSFVPTWNYTTKCAGITFNRQLGSNWDTWGANCWLKNGTTVSPVTNFDELSASVVV